MFDPKCSLQGPATKMHTSTTYTYCTSVNKTTNSRISSIVDGRGKRYTDSKSHFQNVCLWSENKLRAETPSMRNSYMKARKYRLSLKKNQHYWRKEASSYFDGVLQKLQLLMIYLTEIY